MLGERAERGVVVRDDGHGQVARDQVGDRHVPPAEVRGPSDDPVGGAHETGNGESHRDDPVAASVAEPRRDVVDDAGRGLGVGHGIETLPDAGDDAAAEADERTRHGIHLGVDRDGDRTGMRGHRGRGATDAATRDRLPLRHESEFGELRDEGGHGRSVEAREGGQFGARPGASVVDEFEDGGEVAATHPVGVVPGWHALTLVGLICCP